MKRFITMMIGMLALAFAGTAAATLTPSVYDPGSTGCPVATYHHGVLHLEKNCATSTNAAAGADITGVTGPFTSASFTLASAAQCQGGSPRFDIQNDADTVFFLGCNNVTPTINADGTATYTFTPASIAAAGLPVPTGNIKAADVLIDVQGRADLSKITLNGQLQVPTPTTTGTSPTSKNQCKHGGYKTFTSPHFKNQGQCIKFVNHLNKKDHGKKDNDDKNHGEKHHLVKH